jgi:hypothetical protein
MANFDHVKVPIDMRVWNGRRFENILKLDRSALSFNPCIVQSLVFLFLIYMIDSDRRPASNRRPLLKLASADVIISNHCPILGYSQIYSGFFSSQPNFL